MRGASLISGAFTWTATVAMSLEAGEQMRRFAGTVHRFLRPSA
ncbi:DUF6228 family protein [Nocardia araoensis]